MSQQDVEVTDAEDVLDEVEDIPQTPQLSDLELEGDIAADYVANQLVRAGSRPQPRARASPMPVPICMP